MRYQTSLGATTPPARIITAEDTARELRELEEIYESLRVSNDEAPEKHERPERRKPKEPSRGEKIPRHEQDEDRWRFERPLPGRDPVTEERGPVSTALESNSSI